MCPTFISGPKPTPFSGNNQEWRQLSKRSRIKTLPCRARNRNKHASSRAFPFCFICVVYFAGPAGWSTCAPVSRSGLIDPGRDSKSACERTLFSRRSLSSKWVIVLVSFGDASRHSPGFVARDEHGTRIPLLLILGLSVSHCPLHTCQVSRNSKNSK